MVEIVFGMHLWLWKYICVRRWLQILPHTLFTRNVAFVDGFSGSQCPFLIFVTNELAARYMKFFCSFGHNHLHVRRNLGGPLCPLRIKLEGSKQRISPA